MISVGLNFNPRSFHLLIGFIFQLLFPLSLISIDGTISILYTNEFTNFKKNNYKSHISNIYSEENVE